MALSPAIPTSKESDLMAKINVSALRPVEAVTEKREFTDPNQSGVVIELAFTAAPDFNTNIVIQNRAAEYVRQFVESGYPILSPNGKKVEISPRLCELIAAIQTLEQPQDDGSRYQFEEWAKISYSMRSAFSQIVIWTSELVEKVGGIVADDGTVQVPNDSAAATGNSSEPPPNITPQVTP